MTVAVETRGGGAFSGQDRRPTGSALGTGSVGVREQQPASGQRVDVGSRDALRAEATDPIVHVIHNDHEYVGALGGAGCMDTQAPGECDQSCPAAVHFDFFLLFFSSFTFGS